MDFAMIQDRLDKIALTIDSLQLWVNHAIESGDIDKGKLAEAQEKIKN